MGLPGGDGRPFEVAHFLAVLHRWHHCDGYPLEVVHTGLAVFEKYLGDALYAMMVYWILRLLSRAAASAVCAMVAMTAIELFQLNDSGPHACQCAF
jgi:hypothetical protein